jgi:hypothetical protein
LVEVLGLLGLSAGFGAFLVGVVELEEAVLGANFVLVGIAGGLERRGISEVGNQVVKRW